MSLFQAFRNFTPALLRLFFISIFASLWFLQDQENNIQQKFKAYGNLHDLLFLPGKIVSGTFNYVITKCPEFGPPPPSPLVCTFSIMIAPSAPPPPHTHTHTHTHPPPSPPSPTTTITTKTSNNILWFHML